MQHYKHRNPPWIKLYAELLDDDSFYLMSDRQKLLYFQLLLLASRRDNKIRNDLEWLNKKLAMKEEIVQNDIKGLVFGGFIEEYDDVLAICAQDALPEKSRVEIEKSKEEKKKRRFTPPSPIEVNSYAKEIGFTLDGNAFCDFYAAKGWKVGTTPMKDWKAAVRTWKSRHAAEQPPPQKKRTCANCNSENVVATNNGRDWWCPKPECRKIVRGY